jgi:hypothetical protein
MYKNEHFTKTGSGQAQGKSQKGDRFPSGEYGVSIKPTAGMALQFEHILPDGSYNRDTWHDGCNVLSGAKITLQKFKELPSEHRQPGDQVPRLPSPLTKTLTHTCTHRLCTVRQKIGVVVERTVCVVRGWSAGYLSG